jgi:hypothetical protein
MRSADNIEKQITDFTIDVNPDKDRQMLDEVLQIQANARRPSQLDLWRIITKSKITKYAAAAVIIAGVTIGINMFTATPAWAIDQTIEALNNIQGIYLSGVAYYPGNPKVDFEIWARPHSENPAASGDFRLREGDHHLCVASEARNVTFVYTERPWQDVVYITEGLNRRCGPFPASDLFSQFKGMATNWKEEYRKDPETGRDSVFVTFEGPALNTAPYWKMQFDVETKLPVHLSVWFNSDYSGQPHFDFTTIVYDPEMSDDLFTFEIPEGAQVVDCRKVRQVLDERPDCGIEVDNLSTEEACRTVAQVYWQAVIDEDVSAIQNIRPSATGSEWDWLSAIYDKDRPVMLMHIPQVNHLDDPGAFAEVTCILTTKEGKTAKSILNVDIRQTSRGKIGVVAGTLGSELNIVN